MLSSIYSDFPTMYIIYLPLPPSFFFLFSSPSSSFFFFRFFIYISDIFVTKVLLRMILKKYVRASVVSQFFSFPFSLQRPPSKGFINRNKLCLTFIVVTARAFYNQSLMKLKSWKPFKNQQRHIFHARKLFSEFSHLITISYTFNGITAHKSFCKSKQHSLSFASFDITFLDK